MEGTFLLAQIVQLVLFFAFLMITPILSIVALVGLRRRELNATAKGIWALVILVPIMGPIAFWIVHPQEKTSHA